MPVPTHLRCEETQSSTQIWEYVHYVNAARKLRLRLMKYSLAAREHRTEAFDTSQVVYCT